MLDFMDKQFLLFSLFFIFTTSITMQTAINILDYIAENAREYFFNAPVVPEIRAAQTSQYSENREKKIQCKIKNFSLGN